MTASGLFYTRFMDDAVIMALAKVAGGNQEGEGDIIKPEVQTTP